MCLTLNEFEFFFRDRYGTLSPRGPWSPGAPSLPGDPYWHNMIEQFSITFRNTIMEVNSTMNQSELEANTCNRPQARENACEQVTIGFGLASYWLRKWRELCQPIIERSKAKLKETRKCFWFLIVTALVFHSESCMFCYLTLKPGSHMPP